MLIVLFILFLSGLEHSLYILQLSDFAESQAGWWWKGPLGEILSSPLLKQGLIIEDLIIIELELIIEDHLQVAFEYLSFSGFVLAVCLYILSLSVILVNWWGIVSLSALRALCSIVLCYSLESSLKVSNITV